MEQKEWVCEVCGNHFADDGSRVLTRSFHHPCNLPANIALKRMELQTAARQGGKRLRVEIALRTASFIQRTGLPTSEITLVPFRGKTFPQWIGAATALPKMGLL